MTLSTFEWVVIAVLAAQCLLLVGIFAGGARAAAMVRRRLKDLRLHSQILDRDVTRLTRMHRSLSDYIHPAQHRSAPAPPDLDLSGDGLGPPWP